MYRYVIFALIFAAACTAPVSSETLEGRVVTVYDGDSFILLVGSEQIGVRMAEIDTPELGQEWHDQAGAALREKILRQRVRVEIVDKDRYDRLVARVWLGERDINREMIAEGHAWAYRQFLRDESLLELEATARAQLLGLWSGMDPLQPWQWRRQRRIDGEERRIDEEERRIDEEEQGSENCLIKGNIARSGERIYHAPGQEYYEPTRISESKGERWFCSESEARAAGWRKARN